ncbi:hypothetical protein [Methylobacterium sp. WL19]|uniref:hypothetical protein n=1 Tax=Methylobacterium sp. WL19 TaxID=2603896 RepID=UPI0011CBA196|nr:hypothetical protein [Methylobacterium sp. WL19]TXN29126.1 hypothetical protein FV220_07580 [Methylobacterium sp. WL19]
MRFKATGQAAIMSETPEGFSLAKDAARLDAKAILYSDRRIQKTTEGKLHGVSDYQACRDRGKVFLTVVWDAGIARHASEAAAAMADGAPAAPRSETNPKLGVDRVEFDRLMR